MSDIKTEHNGHGVRYVENQDVWRCWELDVEANTLSALRAKINKIDADGRRLDNVNVLLLEYDGSSHEAVATILSGDHAWLMIGKDGKPQRRKEKLSRIVLDTPDNRRLLKDAQTALFAARKADKTAREMIEAIPRVTTEALRGLAGRDTE